MLKVSAVRLKAGSRYALEGVDFTWARGLLAVVGGNGAGKSVLLKIVAGAVRPSAGSATWNGEPCVRAARRFGKIGYAPQERDLSLAITLREFLSLCADLRGLTDRRPAVAGVVRELGLNSLLDERLDNMSGGGRRKAMTAQALLGKPELAVLDEPTSEIDQAARQTIWTALHMRSREAALVVATHDTEPALAMADAVLLLRGGRVVKLATASDFKLAELHDAIAES
jgi:ABC-type multidrug transport system ATPase subunit